MTRRAAGARGALVAALAVVALGGLGACGDDEPNPAAERRERVEARLRDTFSAAQARCIVERSDADVIRALDRTADLDPASAPMRAYSDAVAACVADPTSTTSPTTSSTPSTTVAPPTTTTAPG
ncbi:MAG TPA: hypothetical protein VHK88_07960 [Aquihabitans sp.]|nr:hypothetical protein [Aquihabitans sp.]